MKPLDVTGGTFILGGTFQKNYCKGHLVRLLETVRLFGSGQYAVFTCKVLRNCLGRQNTAKKRQIAINPKISYFPEKFGKIDTKKKQNFTLLDQDLRLSFCYLP